MTIDAVPLIGSAKVIAVGPVEFLTRGRPSEFRHHGLTVAARSNAMDALMEVGRDPAAIVMVASVLDDVPATEFIDLLQTFTRVPVIAALASDTTSQAVSELYDHGIAGTVRAPVTPSRLASAVRDIRGSAEPENAVMVCGALELNDSSHRVTWHGRDVVLARRSFDVLRYMMSAYPRVIPLSELAKSFGTRPRDEPEHCRSTIFRLRAAFASACPNVDSPIETVHRVGYRLAV